MKRKLDKSTKLLLYKTLFLPHLNYCSSVLFLSNEQQLIDLQRVQNIALRHILLKDRYEHIESMLNELSILDVKQQIYYNTLILLHKAEYNRLPEYISEIFKYVGDNQPYNLRNNKNFSIPQVRTAFAQNSVIYKGIQLYNQFKTEFSVTQNMNKMKKLATQFVKNKFKSH